MMRFSTNAPAHFMEVLGQVSSVRNVEDIAGLCTFTVEPEDAPAIIHTITDSLFAIYAGSPRVYGKAPEPRGIPATTAMVKR